MSSTRHAQMELDSRTWTPTVTMIVIN